MVLGYVYVCFKFGKKLSWSKIGVAEVKPTDSPPPIKAPLAEVIPVEQPPDYLKSAEPLNVCRVPDARKTKTTAFGAIAYPVSSGSVQPVIPNYGGIRVAIIPIDFSDVPGTVSPSSILNSEIEQIHKWLKHFSNGKTEYIIQTSEDWIRASKSSDQYQWEHPGLGGNRNPNPEAKAGPYRSPSEIATDLMRDAQNKFDYRNLKIVFFVYPKHIINIYDAMTSFSSVDTNIGRLNLQINATGAWLYRNNFPIWSWFLHENLHPTGLAGHAPMDGSPFNIMTNQSGLALGLSAWDQSILDWQGENQIYCLSKSNLKEITLPLNSINSDDANGTKAIFIKISNSEVLVIESHRYGYWSSGWLGYPGLPRDFKGLLVYKVDTSIDRNRTSNEEGFSSYLLTKNFDNGTLYSPYGPAVSLRALIKVGQEISSNGITISSIKSGSYETVKITRE